jgi:hypothetical protein
MNDFCSLCGEKRGCDSLPGTGNGVDGSPVTLVWGETTDWLARRGRPGRFVKPVVMPRRLPSGA